MVQTSFGRIKVGKKTYTYMVKMDNVERTYRRVGSAPCRTTLDFDSRLRDLLDDQALLGYFISGIEIVVRRA
jgi:hypothetical protein